MVHLGVARLAFLLLLAPQRPQANRAPQAVHCPIEGGENGYDGRAPFERSEVASETKIFMNIINEAGEKVSHYWLDFDGVENFGGGLTDGEQTRISSYSGHVINVRRESDQQLLISYVAGNKDDKVVVHACDGGGFGKSDMVEQARWAEFAALVDDGSMPCGDGPSKDWSCVRWVSSEEVRGRSREKFGFGEHDLPTGRYVGQQLDDAYGLREQHLMFNVTEYDKGYLKMKMTNRLKEILYPWFDARRVDSVEQEEWIDGGYANDHRYIFDRINLDKHPRVHQQIISEMRHVMEWWTKMKLEHEATYGIRIYRRGAVLMDHIDVMETHIASGVLQVGQMAEEGWPLEVINPNMPGRIEVYLQPGEIVLYEGARLQHGRPMRFNGDEFANIFTHFSPPHWRGTRGAKPNPNFNPETAKDHRLSAKVEL